jgi:hypothetical protein
MPPIRIAGDSKLSEVIGTVSKPEDYLCGLIPYLHKCEKGRGNAFLRIATLGTGQAPHYRIEYQRGKSALAEGDQAAGSEAAYEVVGAFQGRNHKPLVAAGEQPESLKDENWSTRTMSYSEVKELLGELRNSGKGRRN